MNKWIFMLVFFIPLMGSAQKSISLKKKYLGDYKGVVPAYQVQTDDELLNVGESAIYLTLNNDNLELKIGNKKEVGTYFVLFKTRAYYLLEAKLEGQSYTERFLVYIRGKKIIREGIFPQPNTDLEKY